jgi:hypothetical protein
LQAVMALLGVQFPFAEAAVMLEKLTLVQVSPNACRKATETLGALVAEQEQAAVQTAWTELPVVEPSRSEAIAGDFYVSMDGVTVHIEEHGAHWLWNLAEEHFPKPPKCSTGITPPPTSGKPPMPSMAKTLTSPSTGPNNTSTCSGMVTCKLS